jgi:hypothetical protein
MPEISDPSGAGDDPQAQPGARLEAPPTVTQIEDSPATAERVIKPIQTGKQHLPGVTNAAKDDDDLFGPRTPRASATPQRAASCPRRRGRASMEGETPKRARSLQRRKQARSRLSRGPSLQRRRARSRPSSFSARSTRASPRSSRFIAPCKASIGKQLTIVTTATTKRTVGRRRTIA